MEEIHWSWTTVQYRAAVNSELMNTLDRRKEGEFLDTSVAQN